MNANLSIWEKLSVTDPTHTKPFQRQGGFRGTAVKPIYTDEKMTEVFGPCGSGWGFTEPQFQLVNGSDGQVAIYCWTGLWYVKDDGQRSELIPGVGGDFVVKSMRSGLSTDDEAFKKAFTDAIGNAMKHLGMSADVHMGQFDGSKYVNDYRDNHNPQVRPASRQGEGDSTAMIASALMTAIARAASVEELKLWAEDPHNKRSLDSLPDTRANEIREHWKLRRAELREKEAA